MFGLTTAILTTLGSTGIGSVLKIIAGIVDQISAAGETREKRELLREVQSRELDIHWASAVFGSDAESQMYGRGTRRKLALMGMSTFSVIVIYCTIFPDQPIVTFRLPEHTQALSLLWGAITIPTAPDDPTVTVTTGHIVVMGLAQLGLVFGFYFTPSGRK